MKYNHNHDIGEIELYFDPVTIGVIIGTVGFIGGAIAAGEELNQQKRQLEHAEEQLDVEEMQAGESQEQEEEQLQETRDQELEQAEERLALATGTIGEEEQEALVQTYMQQRGVERQAGRQSLDTRVAGEQAVGQQTAGAARSGVRKSGSAAGLLSHAGAMYDIELDRIASDLQEQQSLFDLSRDRISAEAERRTGAAEQAFEHGEEDITLQYEQSLEDIGLRTTQLTERIDLERGYVQGEQDWLNQWGWLNVVTGGMSAGMAGAETGYTIGSWL